MQYLKGISVFKFENFHILETLFYFFLTFSTVYNLKNSDFIYAMYSKFQQNHFDNYSKGIVVFNGSYSKGIVVFKFENFHLLETVV